MQNNLPECQICSFNQTPPDRREPVHHRHFSSLYLRKLTVVESSGAEHQCPSCMRRHPPYPENRLKVVVSDSTLHQVFAPSGHINAVQYSGDSMHIDYLTIPDADLKTLTNAFRIEYMDEETRRRPMDVVLVAGYTNLVEGHARDYIVEKFHIFADMIMNESRAKKLDRTAGNTVAICSLTYPPKLAWLPDNGPVPHDGYVNNWDKISWINSEIELLNLAYNCHYPPRFHTYGIRSTTRRRVDMYGHATFTPIKSHRWEHWSETNPVDMLHLSNERRFKMASAINNYFRINT